MSIVVKDLEEMHGKIVYHVSTFFGKNPLPVKFKVRVLRDHRTNKVESVQLNEINGHTRFITQYRKSNKKRIFDKLFLNELDALTHNLEQLKKRIDKSSSPSLKNQLEGIEVKYNKRRNIMLLQDKL